MGDRPSQLGHWMVRLASHLLEWDGYGGLSGQLHCTRFSIELSRGRHIAWSCFTSDAKKGLSCLSVNQAEWTGPWVTLGAALSACVATPLAMPNGDFLQVVQHSTRQKSEF